MWCSLALTCFTGWGIRAQSESGSKKGVEREKHVFTFNPTSLWAREPVKGALRAFCS